MCLLVTHPMSHTVFPRRWVGRLAVAYHWPQVHDLHVAHRDVDIIGEGGGGLQGAGNKGQSRQHNDRLLAYRTGVRAMSITVTIMGM